MKIDIIHVYDHAIKRLKHGFLTNAHCKSILRPTNAISHFAASSNYETLAEFAGAFFAMFLPLKTRISK